MAAGSALLRESSPASSTAAALRLLRSYVRQHAGRIVLALLGMIAGAAATAGNAWVMQPVLDKVFFERDETMLVLIPLAVVGLAATKGLSTYLHEVAMAYVSQRVIADLQKNMFAHLMRADLAFFHANPTGTLISRFTTDVHLLRTALTKGLTGFVRDTFTLLFLLAIMFHQEWRLALIAFVAFPLAVFPVVRLGQRMRRVSMRTQEEMGGLADVLGQIFQGARHVKAYGMEAHEASRAESFIDSVFALIYRAMKIRTATKPMIEVLAGAAVALVIFYGGSRVMAGDTTPGTFFSFIAALMLAYQPIKNLAELGTNLQEGLAATDRIFALLDVEPEIRDRPGARDLVAADGAIHFDEVRFAYRADVPALRGLSLTAPPGRTVALVGPSGAGKSTVLNLIPRFYDVESGRITIGGTDIRDVTLASLRAQIALVSQEAGLFDDTIRANIAYGRPDAADAEIADAARKAAAHDFILALPHGYETRVGEQGVTLSGGERQRIAIARAVLKNAPILLLDEATSALDSEAEQQVRAALDRLRAGRTTLVIAHRLATVVHADLIYVIDAGRVVESGSHAELLARNGLYARLYALQFAPEPARATA